jgi:NAD(P)-dependent dehydrogenase (short-subunit alcohol dehydrogenase family)
MNVKDKIVVIIGGSGLLGREIIDLLIEGKAVVYNIDLNKYREQHISNIQCDITDENQLLNALNAIGNKNGKIDSLINNGYPRTKDWGNKLEQINYSSWNQNVEYQMSTVFWSCKNAVPFLKQSSCPSIVNVASIYGVVGPSFDVYEGTEMTMPAAYSAIKGGIINFSRYLAAYYGKDGIRVNVISPGGIQDSQDSAFIAKYSEKTPLKRMGKPKDIAPSVLFLISESSSYITGQNLIIDGGWTAI